MILLGFLSNKRRHSFYFSVFLVVTASCLPSIELAAEVIHIPVGEQAPELRDLARPVRGMSQDTVLAKFGEPLTLSTPVGSPPISKWHYGNFTVYFESSTVIHSVLTHTPRYLNNTP